jgi:predicted dehydrogenase
VTTIAVVGDSDFERARALGARFGAEAVDHWSKVTDFNVEAVIVATRHDRLAPIALAALETGKHVLVEKPAARCLRGLLPVREAARRHGVSVKAGYNHRDSWTSLLYSRPLRPRRTRGL